jgi:HEAT repeat protein
MDARADAVRERELERLIAQLRSPDVTLRSDAAHALGKLGGEEAVEPLIEALQDPDEYVRKSAVTSLRRIGGQRAMEGLRLALSDRSEQVCLQAVNALGEMRDKGAVEGLIRVLSRRERTLQSASMKALTNIGGDAVPALMEAFKDRQVRRRIGNQILKILVDMGPRAIDPLLNVLEDENLYIRQTAISVLGTIGDRRVIAPLVRLFIEDPRVQEAVVTTLAKLEARGVEEPQETPYADKEIYLTKGVREAFSAEDRAKVWEALTAAQKHTNPKVRRFACKALFCLFGDEATDALLSCLQDEDIDVKRLVIRILSKLKDKRVINPLVELLLKDGDQLEDAVWNTIRVLVGLREYEELRARVAKERAGAQPTVRQYKKTRDVSPDWWREQD